MEKLSRQPGPQRPFEEMFELACEFLSSPWNIWENGALTAKRTVLKLAFAERPAYLRNQGFRTPKTTLPFKLLGDIHMGKCELAEREGFEPSVPAKAQRFSRPPRSTTPAPLRGRDLISVPGSTKREAYTGKIRLSRLSWRFAHTNE